MNEYETKVREVWEMVLYGYAATGTDQKPISIWIGLDHLDFSSYLAAAEFTDERLEEIRRVRGELEAIDLCIGAMSTGVSASNPKIANLIQIGVRLHRVFDRTEAHLADLQRGMRVTEKKR